MNYTIPDAMVDCGVADFTGWWEDQVDSLYANATDNCGIDTIYHSLPDTLTDNCGVFTDTFFVVDNSGNEVFQVASYTIQDSQAPVLMGVPADTLVSCSAVIPAAPLVTAPDNCIASGFATVIFSQDTIDVGAAACADFNYNLRRIWVASDGCGNIARDTQIVQVRDTIAPQFNIPANLVLACSDTTTAFGDLSAIMDNCSPNNPINLVQDTLPGACPQEKTVRRTWTITDVCGNAWTKQQTIVYEDNLPPVASFPGNITVDCEDANDLTVTGEPTMISDNCGTGTVTKTDAIVAGSCTNSYTIERTWTVADQCGNSASQMQVITVTDLIAPVINNQATGMTITCDDALNADSVFMAWVAARGAATATDNCTSTANLSWAAFNTGTNNPASLPAPDCGNTPLGIYRRRTVAFVVTDQCGNRDTTTATFTVADNTPPVISDCPADLTLDTDPGDCTKAFTLALPQVTEECGNSNIAFNLSQSDVLVIPSGSDPVETPVNDVMLNFPVPGPPYTTIGTVSLVITLENVDGEAPTEFFRVYGEDGSLLGQTNLTPAQCGNSTTSFPLSATQLNDWALDGQVTVSLKPNIPAGQPGRFSVNPICPNNQVVGALAYNASFPNHLQFEYSINGSARTHVAPIALVNELLDQGTNLITYYFTDCAGNQDSCSYTVTVEDNEAPVVNCPADFTVYLAPDECEMDVEIPLFNSVTDNCAVTDEITQSQPAADSARLITFSYNPNLTDFVADDKTFVFNGLSGNATPGGVQLILTIQADVDSTGEYFEIYDQDGAFLGTTAPGQPHVTPGDCNTPSTAVFEIPAQTFNDWASNGDITITARSYMNYPIPPAGPGWGINPCDTSMVHADGDTDGSYLYATFRYQSVSPLFWATGATTINPETLFPPLEPNTYSLNQGTTTFYYSIPDEAGNIGQCSFDVTVADTIAPIALCSPTFVDINPSGFVIDTIFAQEIDLGSSDNCGIASMEVIPDQITCNEAFGPSPVVTLVVTDASGNVSTCNTFVTVTTTSPEPFSVNNCGSPDLQLFANPPASPGGPNVYQYTWWNPSGNVFSFQQNPVIQDANNSDLGFYVVVIQGVTGCQAMATVQVTCDMLPLDKPSVMTPEPVICSDENIQLTTPTVCGSTVIYKWYTGTAPNGMLMGETTVPFYSMTPPASGTYNFYVVVERSQCDSEPSNGVTIEVKMKPVATPAQTNLILCEGESILLNSINNAPGTTCQWTGPCGFQSTTCSPAPIFNATDCNSGVYQLVVSNNGCESTPATVAVTVVDVPAKPFVTNTTSAVNPACEGESVVLTATPVMGAISYQWTTPVFTTLSTPTHVLTLQNVELVKDAGQWTVKAIGNPCESFPSEPTTVHIVTKPQAVTATANPTGICEGQSLQLSGSSASPNVNYLWTYPSGQTDAQQNPVIGNITSNQEGVYVLQVTNQFGCTSTASAQVEVFERVQITGISSNAPSCVSGPINVQLSSTLFPLNDGTYQFLWTGPNSFVSTQPSAIIPNATFSNSGAYTLVVTNAEGCSSLPSTVNVQIPEILPTPNQPQMSASSALCEGDAITFSASPTLPGPNVSYVWHTPTGLYSTSVPSFTINDLTVADAGAYSVQYRSGDCLSGISGSTTLVVNAAPLIQPASNSPVCEGETIELSLNCTPGASYEWTGPGGFTSGVCNPVIVNASPAVNAGTYTVRKRVSGCWSDVAVLNIEIKPEPETPTAVNAGPYCAGSENVMLSVTPNSATPGAMYTWYNTSGVPIGAPTASLNFQVPNATQYGNSTVEFYVEANLNGCISLPSVPTPVTLNVIPNNVAEAGPDISACENAQPVTLQATSPTIGSGLWTLASGNPNGVSIANPDEPSTTIAGLIPGETYVFQWTLSNGACENYSSDQASVYLDILEDAVAGDQVNACQATTVTLGATPPQSNIGEWSQPASQADLGVIIADPGNPATQVTGLVPGNSYIFTWTIDGGCGLSSDVVLVQVYNESAFAGSDFEDCSPDNCLQLSAIDAANGSGKWTSPDASLDIKSPDDPQSVICNLQPGENILVWTINNGVCGHLSVDSVVVFYRKEAQPFNDSAKVDFAGEITFDVTANDNIPGFFNIEIVQPPLHGTAAITFDGKLTYSANVGFVGTEVIIYEICSEGCGCNTAVVKIEVGENAECVAPSIITPNKDGWNDAFVIPCLGDGAIFPNSALGIYNQWGDEVFHAAPYKNDWEGTFDGEELPAGTYFYILDPGDGSGKMSGYLILQR
jgi:gliding motility-associated-like protein